MHFTQTLKLSLALKLGLAFAGLCTLAATARPAEAQIPGQLERFTLSGVTFADGATASGSFTYNGALVGTNPATPVSSINVTTTKGVTDSIPGTQYLGFGYFLDDSGRYGGQNNGFSLQNVGLQGQQSGSLILVSAVNIDFNSSGTNVIPLVPGYNNPISIHPASGSSETTSGTRQIVSGFLIETPAAVPEASTTVSFGLLLALGMGGVVIAAKKKAAASA